MSAHLQINTRVRRLIHYMEDIEKGLIQIPAFQRDFIWKANDKLELFDSIKRGYPIGSILFWKPENEPFEEGLKIGPYIIPTKSHNYFYILDGFQRLSTLFGCLTNPNKTTLQFSWIEWNKEYQICYDLDKEEFFIPRSPKLEAFQVPIYLLIDTRSSFNFQKNLYNNKVDQKQVDVYMDRYEKLGTTLIDYHLPSIDIIGGEIEEAVEIFSRVNSKGADISPDWMVSALTYNKDKDFRLASLIDNLTQELRIYNFNRIKRELVLQCIINSFGKVFFDQTKRIEQLAKREDFVPIAQQTIASIKKAIQFLYEELLVIDSKLLPYNNQLIFITDFFNSVESPTAQQLNAIKKWFWVTTYAGYFTIYSLSKQREAYYVFREFVSGLIENPIYNDKPEIPFSVSDFPNKIYFGSVRAKGLILFLLNYSNGFSRVNCDDVEGLYLNYLFFDVRDDNGNFYPESVVPIINTFQQRPFKSKDVSFLLGPFSEENGKYFITEDMKRMFLEGRRLNVLQRRKRLIMEAEREFVMLNGMRYANNDVAEF